jgi:hypothetical protein
MSKSTPGTRSRRDVAAESEAQAPKRGRGRPPGSVALTAERRELILSCLAGGALLSEAAEAAGISPRTLREWIARGEGRSNRPSTRQYRQFATDVRRVMATARIDAVTRIHKTRPEWWLPRAARTSAEREGWTEPPAGSAGDQVTEMGEDQLQDELAHLLELRLRADPNAIVPRCSKPRCGCDWHRRRPA